MAERCAKAARMLGPQWPPSDGGLVDAEERFYFRPENTGEASAEKTAQAGRKL